MSLLMCQYKFAVMIDGGKLSDVNMDGDIFKYVNDALPSHLKMYELVETDCSGAREVLIFESDICPNVDAIRELFQRLEELNK